MIDIQAILGVTDPVSHFFGSVREGYNLFRKRRIELLLESIEKQLLDQCKISQTSMAELISGSHQEHFQECIYQVATKALVAESTLAIKIMAVVAAKCILDKSMIPYDELTILRACKELSDEEIILCRMICDLYERGEMPSKGDNEKDDSNGIKDMKLKQAHPYKMNEVLKVEHYERKIEILKKAGVLGDDTHGGIGQSGGWGHLAIKDITLLFAKYIRLAEGF